MENSYGVVIGRFQPFHEGHAKLVAEVLKRHPKVLILVGQSPLPFSSRNPLPFPMVDDMIFRGVHAMDRANVEVTPILDQPTDELWSYMVDRAIETYTGSKKAVIYGSRDSFSKYYTGKYKVETIEHTDALEASDVRNNKAINFIETTDSANDALIWASQRMYPSVIPTVDVAAYTDKELVMIRKPNETLWRLPGGFADPASVSYEQDASRELYEETGLGMDVTSPLQYVGSYQIDDWRYRSEKNKIRTMLYATQIKGAILKAGDDAAEAAYIGWQDLNERMDKLIVPTHHILVDSLLRNVRNLRDKM